MGTIEAVVGVINGLTSSDPKQRERSADEVTDILGGFGRWENDLVSRLLVSLWLIERSAAAQEAQLHALAELSERFGLHDEVRARLLDGDLSTVPQAHQEYIEGIRSDETGSG